MLDTADKLASVVGALLAAAALVVALRDGGLRDGGPRDGGPRDGRRPRRRLDRLLALAWLLIAAAAGLAVPGASLPWTVGSLAAAAAAIAVLGVRLARRRRHADLPDELRNCSRRTATPVRGTSTTTSTGTRPR